MSYNEHINFFEPKLSEERFSVSGEEDVTDGLTHTAMFSGFFADASQSPMCTNGMYESFLGEIKSSVDLYKTREKLNDDRKLLFFRGFDRITDRLIIHHIDRRNTVMMLRRML